MKNELEKLACDLSGALVVASAIKIGAYRLLEHRSARDTRHLVRIERHVAA